MKPGQEQCQGCDRWRSRVSFESETDSPDESRRGHSWLSADHTALTSGCHSCSVRGVGRPPQTECHRLGQDSCESKGPSNYNIRRAEECRVNEFGWQYFKNENEIQLPSTHPIAFSSLKVGHSMTYNFTRLLGFLHSLYRKTSGEVVWRTKVSAGLVRNAKQGMMLPELESVSAQVWSGNMNPRSPGCSVGP
jgi:hypothetical protein